MRLIDADAKKFCIHSDGLGYCDILSDDETRQYCVESPCPHEKLVEYEPVRHARWEYHECVCSYDGTISGYSCPECNGFVDEEMFDTDEFHKNFLWKLRRKNGR